MLEDFDRSAENRYAFLKREIESDMQALLMLKAFYVLSGRITKAEFHAFSTPLLMKHPSIQALEWIPRTSNSQREEYEKAAQRDGFSGFQITEWVAHGKMVRAGQRAEYFPVYFVEPYKGNEIALGFDLASNPTRKESLERSRDTGEEVATARIVLVQEKTNQFGFLVFSPIYKRGAPDNSVLARREGLLGFALGVFRIGDIMEKSLTYLKPEGIDVYLYDRSLPEKERLLCFHPARTRITTASPISDEGPEPSRGLTFAKTLNVAGREWLLRCVPTPDYIAKNKSLQPWGALSIGLLLTGLLSGFLLVNLRRSEELLIANEQLVHQIAERKRADEALKNSEERFRSLFESSRDALMTLEPPSWAFTSGNPATVTMFRCKNEEDFISHAPWQLSPERQPDGRASGEKAKEMIETAMREGSHFFEWIHKRIDGEEFPATVLLTRMELAGRRFLQATVRDITDSKRAEEALRASEAELYNNYFAQTTINMIMIESMKQIPVEEFLRNALNMIVSNPWIAFEPIGSISIAEDQTDVLVMKAQINLPEPLIKSHISFGKCLCGKAAQTRQIQFADHIDERHEICCEGIAPHGHYAVPLLFGKSILGVINIHLKEGHIRSQKEEDFLRTIADTMLRSLQEKR